MDHDQKSAEFTCATLSIFTTRFVL